MYPIIKLAWVLLGARFRDKITHHETSVLDFHVGLTDVDMFMELNNARYLNYMELGRWDYTYRVGFVSMMKSKKWGVAVGGASIRYRRRIPLFRWFSVTTKLL